MGLERDRITTEAEPKRKLRYGIVLSNLANDSNPQFQIPQNTDIVVRQLMDQQLGIEFQIEADNFYIPELSLRPIFVGLHQPIRGIDFFHEHTRKSSIGKIKEVLQAAHSLHYSLDYIVFHIEPYDYWDDVTNRENRIKRAKEWFEELIEFHNKEKMTIPLLVENLEFPKYPATIEDISDCIYWIQSLRYEYLGFAFDFAHLWRSGQLIATNMNQNGVRRWQNEWSNQTINFLQLLDRISEIIRSNVRLLHITSGQQQQTHLLPKDMQQDTTAHLLNGYAMLQYFLQIPALRNTDLFVINEAIGYSYTETIQTASSFKLPYEY